MTGRTLLPVAPVAARLVDDAGMWEAAVDHLNGSLLQSWRWGAFKSRHGWSAARLLLTAEDEAYAAAQVLFRRLGPFTAAYVPRGPAIESSLPSISTPLTAALDRICRARRAAILFLEPDRALPDLPVAGSLAWQPSVTQFQPLRTIKVRADRSDDELLAAMKPKTRYNVRLAERRGVVVRQGTRADLPRFYRLLQETSSRDEFGIHRVEYFRDLLDAFGPAAALLIAEYEGEIAAGIIVARQQQEAIYLYGASSTALQRHMPAYLIQYAGLRWAREQGCRWYDLWGVPASDEPPDGADDGANLNVRSGLWGVYRFKQGFGGETVSYPGVYERVYARPLVTLWRRFGPGLG